MSALNEQTDRENEIRQALRRSPSFVTPGGLKFWPLLDYFNAIIDERDEARKEQEFYEIECSALRQEVDDAQADAKTLREAGRRWLSETGPGQHTNTAVGRHMMVVAIGEDSQ